jgi:hypothetical protein
LHIEIFWGWLPFPQILLLTYNLARNVLLSLIILLSLATGLTLGKWLKTGQSNSPRPGMARWLSLRFALLWLIFIPPGLKATPIFTTPSLTLFHPPARPIWTNLRHLVLGLFIVKNGAPARAAEHVAPDCQ